MAIRITNSMMVNSFNRNLQTNSRKMEKLQNQIATNKKNSRLSDDAVSVVKILDAKTKKNDVAQYERNLDDAAALLTNTETALNEANEIIKRIYELAVYAANDPLGQEERAAISDEVNQLRDQLLTLGNATIGEKYIFGGYNVTSAPFAADADSDEITVNNMDMIGGDGDTEYIFYEIGMGIDFDVAISGSAFMGLGEDANMWYVLNEFGKELQNPEQSYESLSSFIPKLQGIQNNILTQLAEVGGRRARIDMMKDRYAVDAINYTQMLSDVQDLDQAKGIMDFSMAEAVYRSALGVGGRVLPPTLLDFLR